MVALLAEGVDRNIVDWVMSNKAYVALLAEGVDRNSAARQRFTAAVEVALLAEGVDRNGIEWYKEGGILKSPSSRRAWIEIISMVRPP